MLREKPRGVQDAVRIVATASAETRNDRAIFRTEPDFRPPAVRVVTGPADGTAGGHILLTPRAPDSDVASGPMILDARGRLVFFRPLPGRVSGNLTSQTYRGKPVLTWGERPPVAKPADIFKVARGDAFHVIADQHYREITKVRAVGAEVGTDLHELVITERGSALLIGFRTVEKDLTSVGGPRGGMIAETVVQEVDIASGRLLLEWSPAEQVRIRDSLFPLTPGEAWDAYHANTVSIARDGNLLVTMRHTSAVYKVDRASGQTIWTLGGRSSDFRGGSGTRFHFPHDAQELANGNILLFDNGATNKDRRAKYSRVIELKLDEDAKSVELAREIVHDPPILAISQGGARVLENGNIFVGWGNREWFSEYTREGQLLFGAVLPSTEFQSYRALKASWPAEPHGRPAIAAHRTRARTIVYASWNGATRIARWRVLGGASPAKLEALGTGAWQGFETKLDVARVLPTVQVEALDRDGAVLGRSEAIRPEA